MQFTQVASEFDRLLVRILMAVQAEKGLKTIDTDTFCGLLAGTDLDDWVHTTEEDLRESIDRLDSLGYINRENGEIQTALTGFLDCAILSIPEEVREVLLEEIQNAKFN